ncbi:hypothetical protein PGB90_003053 [Kerria lacca]
MSKILLSAFNSGKHFLLNSKILSENNKVINGINLIQIRTHLPLRIRYPFWFLQKERATYYENLTKKNREFLQDVIEETFGPAITLHGIPTHDVKSPLLSQPFVRGKWNIKSQRCGLIGRKIGIYPMWTKTGERIVTTLIQIVDNHVIKYIPPEEFDPIRKPYNNIGSKKKLGCLLVGAESTDPQKFTKEYCGLFFKQGLMPKNKLGRFLISPEAVIQPGTPLYVNHFRVGQYVDVRGQTIQRGFQGVMKRWGFHGMPATHGVTKTHRRPGCIGMGRDKSVQPGKKMPGHVGYRYRMARGLKVLRINTKYNVMYVTGRAIPGDTGSIVYIYDTNVTHKLLNHHNPPVFPTFYPEDLEEPLPEDQFTPELFNFSDPSIMYEVPVAPKKKK